MRLPVRLTSQSLSTKILAAAAIAVGATALLLLLRAAPGARAGVRAVDELLYDSAYRLRPVTDMTASEVVIIAVDQKSLDVIDQNFQFGWPWPREFWGLIVDYCSSVEAKVVAFDMLFTETSVYAQVLDDDNTFATKVAESTTPVVFATQIKDGTPGRLAPPVETPIFGAVNIGGAEVFRIYPPFIEGKPSLGTVAAQIGGAYVEQSQPPFRLHHYGPHQSRSGQRTFRYISAANVIQAGLGKPAEAGITPEMFRNKIVLVGPIAAAMYDLKQSPFGDSYPGVEVHATAIQNLLRGQFVRELGGGWIALASFLASFLAGVGVVMPRKAWLKLMLAAGAGALLVGVAIGLFLGDTIVWLPLGAPLLAGVLSTVGAFAFSYLTEDRQRRFVVKALGQYLSPEVASQIAQNPDNLRLGGQRREMSVMFTDIQGFTDLSETMEVEKLGELLNFYLDEMSAVVLEQDGTLDKYIGDAIMSFWNAPAEACRAALGMVRREASIQPRLKELGAPNLLTRVGVNTGWMAVGNMGSSRKFNYTVMGDPVNLASRLEGANKLYGSRILIAETTARLVEGHFLMRQLDVLKVKGKQIPMPVYEILDDLPGDPALQDRCVRYAAAYAAYRTQQWDEAEAKLEELLLKHPSDKPAAALLKRVRLMREMDLPPDWNGVYEAKEK
jgi:adenylate cyclase